MNLIKSLLLTLLVVGFMNSCKKDEPKKLPEIVTGNPTVSEAEIILSGEVTFTDGENSTKRGVCWSENPNPTTNDHFYMDTNTGMGSFSVNVISQIKLNTNYYVRAFAENSVGKAYGNVVSLIYKAATELPQVTTANVKISETEIILSGEVTFTDGENSTKRGVCWSENPNPTTNDYFYMDTNTGMGSFSVDVLSQLKPRIKYYVRAFAENSVGKAYGDVVNFTTTYLNPNGAVINSRGCIECDKYEVGDTFTLNGNNFVVADRDMLDKARNNGEDMTKFCTSKINDMSNLFNSQVQFNQNIGNWDVRNVTDMNYMFQFAFAFNQDIGNWDVSNVTDMDYMFRSAEDFNKDLSGWCVKNITSIPPNFSTGSSITPANHPVWGTCP